MIATLMNILQRPNNFVQDCSGPNRFTTKVLQCNNFFFDYSQPIAMVAWASFYADRYVNETASEDWIKNNAMKGPASYILLDGDYQLGLIQPARVVSDAADSKLCPKERLKVRTGCRHIVIFGFFFCWLAFLLVGPLDQTNHGLTDSSMQIENAPDLVR